MNAYEKIKHLNEKEFKLITGVTQEVFEKMLEVLRKKYTENHMQGGQRGMPVARKSIFKNLKIMIN